MADGGEGTLAAFVSAFPNATRVPVTVEGPDGRHRASEWVLLPDGTGIVELASTSGIMLMDRLRPLTAHTRGLGQAIASALDHGVVRLIVALGGSSSTDGGAGALTELGAKFTSVDESATPDGNRGLGFIHRADLSGLRPLPPLGVTILTDVTNPLLGSTGAARVFGAQKGASEGDIQTMEDNLGRFASLIPVEPATVGSGAAGGTAFGLLAWGAEIAWGAPAVGEVLGLADTLRAADVLVTGEGCFDSQSEMGKVPSYVLDVAHRLGRRTLLVAGRIDASTDAYADSVSLTELAGSQLAAQSSALYWLEAAGAHVATRLPDSGLGEGRSTRARGVQG